MTPIDMSASDGEKLNSGGGGQPVASDILSGLDDVEVGAMEVLRRGLKATPELRVGIQFTLVMALASALGKLVIPILIQQILDRGVNDGDYRLGFIYTACAVAVVLIVAVSLLGRLTYRRLVKVAEQTLLSLRVRAFARLHRLSLADHVDSRKGLLTARVTSDIETLSQFAQWGAISWVVNSVVIMGTIAVMALYSWQLTLVAVVIYLPIMPFLRALQRRQFAAYEIVRTEVGDTLGATSEAVMGAGVIRAYGYHGQVRTRLKNANDQLRDAQINGHKYFAYLAPLMDIFFALALSGVVAVGVWWGDDWGLSSGELVAFLFLVQILLNPISELGEVLDQTQNALSGWWKVLQVLELPIELREPDPGVELPSGALEINVENLHFSYRTGPPVLNDVSVVIPAGAKVAVVGETGSGKTTFAKLLARMADPTAGSITVQNVPLDQVSVASRHRSIRMVPQDGFLFDATVGTNIGFGAEGTSDTDTIAALERLGLTPWLSGLPMGLKTPVGERGENLSVGERQLVALARAQLADPGLLILDEATSAVDPETEVALTDALTRLAVGRTTLTVAHRLSTAERSDLVLVFDQGELVEQGTHDQLVQANGVYAGLYRSWIGNTRQDT